MLVFPQFIGVFVIDEALAKALGAIGLVFGILHQIITRDRARSQELQKLRQDIDSVYARKDQISQLLATLRRVEDRLDKLYELERDRS